MRENLSDRQASQAVQGRIDWKYALSLELTDPGFDFTVLSEFRDRLITGGVERQILDLMLSKFQELKLLSVRGKQRTDSTHILAVVRELTRLEHLGETLRYALNAVAEIAPIWLKSLAPAEWYDRYSKRFEDSVDQAYTSAQLLSTSERDYNIDLLGPVALNVGWQAKAGLGIIVKYVLCD